MSKGKHYREDEYVLCPYYRKESNFEVKCDGLCGSHTVNVFQTVAEKDYFKDDFCCGYYWNCPLNRALSEDQ